jgi:NAD(P)-dependent dehydrogenase (short-subunit alcohol dehydrogenase family)
MIERLPQHSAAAFMTSRSATDIANQLRIDDAFDKQGQACSWSALYAPASRTREAIVIAQCLTPSSEFSTNIKRVLYENTISRLRRSLNGKGIFATQHEIDKATKELQAAQMPSELSFERLHTALEVLEYLQDSGEIRTDTSVGDACLLLRRTIADNDATISSSEDGATTEQPGVGIPTPPIIPRKRLCYICRLSLTVPHPTQPAMCMPCGSFNLASSQISEPSKLTLPATFIALVTGARINLGYHTTLRLLRCGARVLATTRYPHDAVARYAQESDFSMWKSRLRVLGADFRCAADVFALVKNTRRCLREWGGIERLHLLVNNAAQTLTDSVRKEERAIERETALLEMAGGSSVCVQGSYKARIRGGGLLMALGGVDKERGVIENGSSGGISPTSSPLEMTENGTSLELQCHEKSSWVQSLFEIPYEDVISAHSVNTFVPLILCRELLPLMGQGSTQPEESDVQHGQPGGSQNGGTKPEGYIVNVSSREGIFEDRTRSIGKAGKHVHTNMSKAALNMITETEAASAWQERRVAMNTVDPGYMSAAPEYEGAFDGQRPIGWEDGAGRVLWPVAVGELKGEAVWGRFLKHYGAVEVDPGAGRG